MNAGVPVVAAPPHVIGQREHPFDPDWLEIRALINVKCVGCHRRDSDRFDFSTYESLIEAGREDGYAAIVPGQPEESTLWEYVSWNANARIDTELPDTPYMPEEKTEWLTPRQLNLVYRWIKNGALQYVLPNTCNITPLAEVDFPSAKECKACHPRYYDEWSRSMHAYSQHSPIFEAFNLMLIERTGATGVRLEEAFSEWHNSPSAADGVTCQHCHMGEELG